MKQFVYLVLFSMLMVSAPRAATLADDIDTLIVRGKRLLQQGTRTMDAKPLFDARALFERLSQNEKMQWLTEYYVGYADYRLAIYFRAQNRPDMTLKYMDEGIDFLNASLEKNEEFADAHALLSSLLAQKIGLDPSQAMTLGMESGSALSEALTYGKNNPRVVMISALSAYFTPEQFGGSKTRAMEEMTRAVELFKAEKLQDDRLPDWGHGEALVWLAKFHHENNNTELAQKYLQQSLQIEPDNAFAKSEQRALQPKSVGQ